MRVWLDWYGDTGSAFRADVERGLTRAGIDVGPREGGGYGVLLLGNCDTGAIQRVRELSRDGIDRLLVIAPTAAGIQRGGAFRLRAAGASDIVTWGGEDEPEQVIAARLKRWTEIDDILRSPLVQDNLIGRSKAWISVLRPIIEVAVFTDSSVLILGESGTGKELIARLIHTIDRRSEKKELVILDCTTVVPELSGSEFFGHERGAFTGAVGPREGAFALAHDGTLFLDEVGELPLTLQAQLLRVVQERTYKKVGGNTWHHANFRLITATNRDLSRDVDEGSFRRDFFHRIAAFTCRIPPLAQRPEDILPLVEHFMAEIRSDGRKTPLDEPVREYILSRPYPGNVRELRQLIFRICKRHVGVGSVTVGDLPEDEIARVSHADEPAFWPDEAFERSINRALLLGIDLKEIGRNAADTAIRVALLQEDNNLQRAAKMLGVTDRALQMRRAGRRAADQGRSDRDAGGDEVI